MTPSEIVEHLVATSPRRTEAFRALKELLDALALRAVPHASDRDEMVGMVLYKLCDMLATGPLPMAGHSDGECRSYLRQMLYNFWASEYRKRRRQSADDPEGALANYPAPDPETSSHAASEGLAYARALLQQVFDHVHAHTRAAYRNGRTLAWRQINELVFERAELKSIVQRDDGLPADATAEALTQALNRAFQQHKRLREALLEAIPAMAEDGLLTNDDARMSRLAVEALVRCQRRKGSGVS
jgi:DNA-directed RNA polymerase specialized sigma24 family protein